MNFLTYGNRRQRMRMSTVAVMMVSAAISTSFRLERRIFFAHGGAKSGKQIGRAHV